jgi:phenylacetate-CoA ligase
VKACDAYGLIEVGLLGFECRLQEGLHGFEDSYMYEIVDPKTGEILDAGEEGELVVTHLAREGIPLIRYRTGDITSIDDSPCPCGRTHLRLQGVKGRWTDRLEVQGKVLYASLVDEAMAQIGEYKGGHNIFINGTRKLDTLEIAVDQDQIAPSLSERMRKRIEGALNVPVRLKSLPASQLFVFPHRSRRIIDQSNVDTYQKELKTQMAVET